MGCGARSGQDIEINGQCVFDLVEAEGEINQDGIEEGSALAFAIKVAYQSSDLTPDEMAMTMACPKVFLLKQLKMKTWYHVLGSRDLKGGVAFGSFLLFTARGKIVCQQHESSTCGCCYVGREDITGQKIDEPVEGEEGEDEEAEIVEEEAAVHELGINRHLAETTKPRVLSMYAEGYADFWTRDIFNELKVPDECVPTIECTCRKCQCNQSIELCECPLFEREVLDKNCVCRLKCSVCNSSWSETRTEEGMIFLFLLLLDTLLLLYVVICKERKRLIITIFSVMLRL